MLMRNASLNMLFTLFGYCCRYKDLHLTSRCENNSPGMLLGLFYQLLIAGIELNPGPALTTTSSLHALNGFALHRPDLSALTNITVRSITVPVDGHCFIHALRISISSQPNLEVTYNIIRKLGNKVIEGEDNYFAFYNGNLSSFHTDATT